MFENLLSEQELDQLNDQETSDVVTAFEAMKNMMDKFKEFCDSCQDTWKIQEIPAPVRQRLITLDQHNQQRYQQMYNLMKKYASDMKHTEIKDPKNGS
jgi:phosphoenolpyruvate carboxylase